MGAILIAGLASLLISIFLGPKYIEYLRRREFGQQIREEGPAEHHLKAGTPTMGGLVVFTAIGIPYLILSDRDAASLAVFGTALASAAIGFVDDWLKIVKARSLGLSARTKLGLQLLIAIERIQDHVQHHFQFFRGRGQVMDGAEHIRHAGPAAVEDGLEQSFLAAEMLHQL